MTIVNPQEIEKALKYKNISDRLYEHLDESLGYFDYYQIVGIFLQGSQNYGLDTEESDIDTKLIVLPKFEDIVFNKQPVSTTHIRENDEHIDFKDLRLYIQTLIFLKKNSSQKNLILSISFRRLNYLMILFQIRPSKRELSILKKVILQLTIMSKGNMMRNMLKITRIELRNCIVTAR